MKAVAFATGCLLMAGSVWCQTTHPPRLYCGTDQTGFEGENGQIAVVATKGPIIGKVYVYNLSFPLNGMTYMSQEGELLTGQPEAVGTAAGNTLRTVSLGVPPALKATILPGPSSFTATCCNEQMVRGPDGVLYHAHYSDVIQSIRSVLAINRRSLRPFLKKT